MYAAYYSDCEHELMEVKAGYRMALVYSLIWNGPSTPPSAGNHFVVIKNIATILPNICSKDREQFVWFLAHKYTTSSLRGNGIRALKGHDSAVANTFQSANELLSEEQQLEFYLTMVTCQLEQFGDFEFMGHWSGWGEFEANGDEEEGITIENEWYELLSGAPLQIKKASIDMENDVVNYRCPPNMSLKDFKETFWGDADEEENTGPTGNEGATQMYWYKNYAIFAWPARANPAPAPKKRALDTDHHPRNLYITHNATS